MNKIKTIFLLLLVFCFAMLTAFFFEENYNAFVRQLFKAFQGNKIQFVGKGFQLFASWYFLIAFGLFSVLLTLLLYGHINKIRLIHLSLTILLFSFTTIATSFIDSTGYVVECTACQDGIRSLHYSDVNYDFHFIISLLFGLLPLLYAFTRRLISKAR